jgi:hypothetical protein
LPLFGIRQELKLECQFHYLGVYPSLIEIARGKKSVRRTEILSLCRLKAAVSKDQIL